MLAMISSICGVVALLLEIWMQNRAGQEEKRYAEIQKGRQDIAAADADAINGRIDRLLSIPETTGDNSLREQCDHVTAGRISAVLGLADAGRGAGEDTGKS
jgi:hypothetical protein